jgi:hypothetical protein
MAVPVQYYMAFSRKQSLPTSPTAAGDAPSPQINPESTRD